MNDLLLRGGRILDPGASIDLVGDVLVLNGRIAQIGRHCDPPDGTCVQIDCHGLTVTPGFIDLHCHLRDPGLTHKETIASGTRAAAAGGFTTVCCMPNTDPVIDNGPVVEYVLRTAREDAAVRVAVIGAVTKGQSGKEIAEMAELAAAGCIGFSDDGHPVSDSNIMRHALEYSRITGRPVIDHCEDRSLTAGASANEGPVASRLGLRGWPAAAEAIAIGRDLILCALTGGRLHIAHVSTAVGVGLIRDAKAKGLPVTAEVTPHHLTLTDSWLLGAELSFPAVGGRPIADRPAYDTRTKVNPPLRTGEDILALVAGLQDGTIDAIATDHAPHALVDKLCEYDRASMGISGLETALGALLSLVETGLLSLELIVEKLTAGPVRVIGHKSGAPGVSGFAGSPASVESTSPGTIAVGSVADIVVFDPSATWKVDAERLLSKGRNSPLDGVSLTGLVKLTVVDGQVVYRG